MTDPTRNERAKRHYDSQTRKGLVKLPYWVSGKSRARLEVLAKKAGKKPADLLEELIQRA